VLSSFVGGGDGLRRSLAEVHRVLRPAAWTWPASRPGGRRPRRGAPADARRGVAAKAERMDASDTAAVGFLLFAARKG
jgi:hypothetical protein